MGSVVCQQFAHPADLVGDFWPEDEDFLKALHEWRGHDRSDRAA